MAGKVDSLMLAGSLLSYPFQHMSALSCFSFVVCLFVSFSFLFSFFISIYAWSG